MLDQGCTTFLLLQAALLLLIWSMAANEFELYLWDTAALPTANQHRTHSNIHCVFIPLLIVTSPSRLLHIVSTDFLALRLFFASIYASAAAKSYILNYMWTAANFVIFNSTPGAIISVPPNKSVYLSAKRGLLKVAPCQINCPFFHTVKSFCE